MRNACSSSDKNCQCVRGQGQAPCTFSWGSKGAILSRENGCHLTALAMRLNRNPAGPSHRHHAQRNHASTASPSAQQPQPPPLGVKRLHSPRRVRRSSADAPLFPCLGSVFVISCQPKQLTSFGAFSPATQCHRAVDDLRVRIVAFPRPPQLSHRNDTGIPYLRRVQRKRRRHTAADTAERRHLVAVHFIGE